MSDSTEHTNTTAAKSSVAATTVHTPGPWHIAKSADGTPAVCVPVHSREGTAFVVAQLNRPRLMGSVTGSADANARLIAAAPELLEALECIVGERMNVTDAMTANEMFEKARAAIARAKGEA